MVHAATHAFAYAADFAQHLVSVAMKPCSLGLSGRPARVAMENSRRIGGRPRRRKVSRSPRSTSSATAYRERQAMPRPSRAARLTASVDPSSQVVPGWISSDCSSRSTSSRELVERELQSLEIHPGTTWELGSTEAVKRAAREGLGIACLSRYAVAEEVERGDLETFRLRGRPPIRREFSIATLAGRPLSPSEQGFIATLTRCCAKSAAYAKACVAA